MARSRNLIQTTKELRAILADMGVDSVAPSRLKRPPTHTKTSKLIINVTRLTHKSLYQVGRLSNHNYKRKNPIWPFEASSTTVLGYGVEKIAYLVTPVNTNAPHLVISVYHQESLRRSTLEVIRKKTEKYEIYRKYFGDLIVPTSFMEVDNPWGEGTKPASVQPYLVDPERFSDYSFKQLKGRATEDPIFAEDLRLIKKGYDRMLADKIRPDFGGGNLVVLDSGIKIFDTGAVVPADKYKRLRDASPAYKLVEGIDTEVLGK